MRKLVIACLALLSLSVPLAAQSGLDAVWYAGGKWNSHFRLDEKPATPTKGIPGSYVSITEDARKGSVLYGAHVNGGIYRAMYNGSAWVASQVINNWGESDRKYVSLTRDAVTPEHIYAAGAEGGIDLIFWDGAQWVFRPISQNAYKVITRDGVLPNTIYGARLDGGLDQICFTDGHWAVEELNTNSYVALTYDTGAGHCIYGARADGLDQIEVDGDEVKTTAINDVPYVSLTGDWAGPHTLFAARKDRGIDHITFDKTWKAVSITSESYCALTHDKETAKAVYAARSGGGLDSISWDEAGKKWQHAYLQSYSYNTSRPYAALAYDAVSPKCIYAAKSIADSPKRKAGDLVVDQNHSAAADTNPGTEDQPLRTIGEAASRIIPGYTIWVKNGTYRESAELPSGEPEKPVSIRAWKGHNPVIKGSEVADKWTLHDGKHPIYWQAWEPYTQMCFVDGEPLKQIGPVDHPADDGMVDVDGAGVADMYAGTFYYDKEAKRVYVWLLDGGNPGSHTVELAVRYIGLRFWDYAHVDGLTIMHCQAGKGRDNTALGGVGSGIVVENVKANHNDFAGLILNGTDCIIRGCEFASNGNAGFTSSQGLRMLLKGNTWHDNNTRRYHPGWNDGTKILNWIDSSIIGNHSYNERSALWLDINNRNILIAENLFENVELGVYWEISRWAIIANNIFRKCSRGVWIYGSDALITNNILDRCRESVVYTTEIRGAFYEHPHLCLSATRNNMAVNNVIVKPECPAHLDFVYRMIGEEEPHGGNNLFAHNLETDKDPFVDSAKGDYRLRDEFKGTGKSVPIKLNSVYTSGALPWAKTLVEDCETPTCEPKFESWWGTKHYRAQPLPEPMDICDIDKQPAADCGINFEWKKSGVYPKF